MTPNTYNFKQQTKNDTFSGLRFSFNSIINEVEIPINLSGTSIQMDIKKSEQSQPSKSLKSGEGITVTDEVNGKVRIEAFKVDLPAFNYVYDLQIIYPDETVKTYLKGTFKVIEDITLNDSNNLLSAGEFATYKSISKKIDKDKIEDSIKLAQSVDLIDVLGDFYFDLIENLSNEDYYNLINGSSFTCNGKTFKQEGIKSYLADLTYARFLYEINTNFTPFGLQQKFTQDSQPVDRNTVRDMVKQSQIDSSIKFKMIDKYLQSNKELFNRYKNNNNPNINTFGQKYTVIK